MKKPRLRLEPHDKFKVALVGKQGNLHYSYWKLVDLFMADGMDEEDAVEWVEYNVMPLTNLGLTVKVNLTKSEAKRMFK
jgi:hypothetical protein